MKLSAILDPAQPVPGKPAEMWPYCPERRAGYLYMDEADYHAFGAVNRSIIKRATLSEMHSELIAPHKDSAAMAVGTLADLAIISGMEHVAEKFAIVEPPLNTSKHPETGLPRNTPYGRDTKNGKEFWEAAIAANPGKFVASLADWHEYRVKLDRVIAAFKRRKLCVQALQNCMLQVTGILWHPQWQCWVKWRPDALPMQADGEKGRGGWNMRDLKYTEHPLKKFPMLCYEFGYYAQSVWYSTNHEAALRVLGQEMRISSFDFLVVSDENLDDRSPRKAMAQKFPCYMDPAGNDYIKPIYDAIYPKDGFGRVEKFLAALREWRETGFDSAEAVVNRVWPAYDDDDEGFPLVKIPRD